MRAHVIIGSLIAAAAVLWAIGRITPEMPWSEIVGKIVIESMTVAIGASES